MHIFLCFPYCETRIDIIYHVTGNTCLWIALLQSQYTLIVSYQAMVDLTFEIPTLQWPLFDVHWIALYSTKSHVESGRIAIK